MTTAAKPVLAIGAPDGVSTIMRALSKVPETYTVLQAPDVEAAVKATERHAVGLALLDVSGTGGTGLDALVELRTRVPSLPVLMMSDVSDDATAMEAVRQGAQDFLVKGKINDAVIARVVRYTLERDRTLSRLRALDGLKSKFVSTVSHEIRTPLAIIREFVSLVHDDVVGPTTREQKDCLESALRNCDRLTSLINDLLDLSRIESGGLTLRRVRTVPRPLLDRVVEDFRPRTDAKQQSLTLEVASNVPDLLCDSDRIEQVLVNLVGNAHKFTPEGGAIAIRARFENGFAHISIEDDGPGIGPQDQQRIFEAFSQVSRENVSDTQGTGLGLTICKNIVDLHGGTISVDSAPGEGSRFTLTLPRYEDGAEFDVFVADRLRTIGPRRKTATIVIVRSRANGSAAAFDELDRFQRCAEATLRSRRDETLLVESKRLVVCLVESDIEGTRIALRRVAESLGDAQHRFEFALTRPGAARTWTAQLAPDDEDFQLLASGPASGDRTRVLLVADDPAQSGALDTLLARTFRNLEVRTTASGYEGCIQYGGFRPEIVILDLAGPDVAAEDVLRSMLAQRGIGSKFVVLSTNQSRFERLRELGCAACLPKPADDAMLLAALRGLLPDAVLRAAETDPVPAGVD